MSEKPTLTREQIAHLQREGLSCAGDLWEQHLTLQSLCDMALQLAAEREAHAETKREHRFEYDRAEKERAAREHAETKRAVEHMVPSSRYWACNADWLRERERADSIAANAKKIIVETKRELDAEREAHDKTLARLQEADIVAFKERAARERAETALRELVRLKDLKTQIELNPSRDWLDKGLPFSAREHEYAESQPKAWESARAALAQPDSGEKA